MGEIADMILDGILDEETGEYIDDEISAQGGGGYPRSMRSGDSFQSSPMGGKFANETQIVRTFLKQRGINDVSQQIIKIKTYPLENGMPQRKVGKICRAIRSTSDSWKNFKSWIDKDKVSEKTENDNDNE